MGQRKWTDEQIIQAFHDWEAIFGSPPRYGDWMTADSEGLYPSAQTVRSHFGSWVAGREAAFPKPGKRKPLHYWTRELIIEALRAWADEHDGLPPSMKDMKPLNGLPSPQTIEDRFGSKAAAMKAAGLLHRPSSVNNSAVKKFLPFSRKPYVNDPE